MVTSMASSVDPWQDSTSTADAVQHQDVINEFDPLTHQEEKEAREAWENTEAHPPQPPPRTPTPPPTPPPTSPPPTASSFTSIAAFARSFSIPSLPRGRPLSLDVAKPVPSPATLSSFGQQQQQQQRQQPSPKPASGDDTVPSKPASRTSSRGADGSDSPKPGVGDEQRKENADVPFDFQKFLDQMKTKNAEPIAKYLKSCVLTLSSCCHPLTSRQVFEQLCKADVHHPRSSQDHQRLFRRRSPFSFAQLCCAQ